MIMQNISYVNFFLVKYKTIKGIKEDNFMENYLEENVRNKTPTGKTGISNLMKV